MSVNLPEFWKQKKEKLKEIYPFLTETDLHFAFGKEKEMIERIGKKIGKSMKELLTIIVTL
jgi:hypothetical protein